MQGDIRTPVETPAALVSVAQYILHYCSTALLRRSRRITGRIGGRAWASTGQYAPTRYRYAADAGLIPR